MNTEECDEELKKLRGASNRAEQELIDAVVKLCPGVHKPEQRRDHLPAWCKVCGRTRRGVRVHPPQMES